MLPQPIHTAIVPPDSAAATPLPAEAPVIVNLEGLVGHTLPGVVWSDMKRGARVVLHHEVKPGLFVHVVLNAHGVLIYNGPNAVCVPLNELVTLALRSDPKLNLPPAPAATSGAPGAPATQGTNR